MLPAIPGQPINLSASDYNGAVEAGRWYQRERRLGGGGNQPIIPVGTSIIIGQNDSGSHLDVGAVVEIADTPLDQPSYEHPWFSINTRSGHDPVCGVLLDPIRDGSTGRVVLMGVAFADVNVIDEDNTHARVVPGSTELRGDFGGWARILQKPSGTGVKRCAVLLGHTEQTVRKAKASGTITAGSTGTANVFISGAARGSVTVYLDWMDSAGNIGSNTELFIQYFHDQDRWQVIGAECST